MRHNHVTRDIRPPGECPACDDYLGAVPVEVVRHVLADEVKRTSAVDLLAWTEERMLRELVSEVYKAGMVGLSWPTLERVPMTLMDGELHETQPGQNVYEWRVVASVKAMPR